MFSKELENLIQATLEDGVLEDNEKAALVKRAQKEGVDLDELEIYINSLLQRRQRELREKNDALDAKFEREKKEAFGRTCPNCGKQVPPLTLKCECGYEFSLNKNVSSMQILSDKLNNITLTKSEEKEIDDAAPAEQTAKREGFLVAKKINIISTFPVPNTKEDIIEFLAVSVSYANKKIGFFDKKKTWYIIAFVLGIIFPVFGWIFGAMILSTKSFADEKLKDTWHQKCEQVLIKGRSLRGDSDFTQQLEYYENLLKEE